MQGFDRYLQRRLLQDSKGTQEWSPAAVVALRQTLRRWWCQFTDQLTPVLIGFRLCCAPPLPVDVLVTVAGWPVSFAAAVSDRSVGGLIETDEVLFELAVAEVVGGAYFCPFSPKSLSFAQWLLESWTSELLQRCDALSSVTAADVARVAAASSSFQPLPTKFLSPLPRCLDPAIDYRPYFAAIWAQVAPGIDFAASVPPTVSSHLNELLLSFVDHVLSLATFLRTESPISVPRGVETVVVGVSQIQSAVTMLIPPPPPGGFSFDNLKSHLTSEATRAITKYAYSRNEGGHGATTKKKAAVNRSFHGGIGLTVAVVEAMFDAAAAGTPRTAAARQRS